MAVNAIQKLTASYTKLVLTVGLACQVWVNDLGAATKGLDRTETTKFKDDLTKAIGPDFNTRLWSTWNAAGIALQFLVESKVVTANQVQKNVIGSMDSLSKIKAALDPADPNGGRSAAIKTLKAAKKAGGTHNWLTSKVAEEVQKANASLKPTNQGNKNGTSKGKGKGKGKGNTNNGGGRNRSPKVSTDALVKAAAQQLEALNKRLATDVAGGAKHADTIRNFLANTATMVANCEEKVAEQEAAKATA